ncbi:MAG: hypothetical protein U0V74_12865 [Chitinophagales bacterium]
MLTQRYLATIVKDTDTITFYSSPVGFEVMSQSINIQGNVLDPSMQAGQCNGSAMCEEQVNGSMTIGSNTFTGVRKFRTQLYHYSSGPFCMADFYWCPNIGPVKIVLSNVPQTTKELYEWQVAQ